MIPGTRGALRRICGGPGAGNERPDRLEPRSWGPTSGAEPAPRLDLRNRGNPDLLKIIFGISEARNLKEGTQPRGAASPDVAVACFGGARRPKAGSEI